VLCRDVLRAIGAVCGRMVLPACVLSYSLPLPLVRSEGSLVHVIHIRLYIDLVQCSVVGGGTSCCHCCCVSIVCVWMWICGGAIADDGLRERERQSTTGMNDDE